MNNFNNCLDIDKIIAQLERADIQKKRLIRNIYNEYELYLNIVRDLLYISVEEGVNELCNFQSINNNFSNANGVLALFEKKIRNLIYKKLPLITIEQLKIIAIEKNINKENNFNNLAGPSKTKDDQKEEFQYEDGFQFEEPMHLQINEDISHASQYYQVENYEKFVSFDLDNSNHPNNNIIENIGLEKQFISSLLELVEEVKVEKPNYTKKEDINQMDIPPEHLILKNFDLIDSSLENVLLNLSHNINKELFKANLINKIISQDSFEYLVEKKLLIKHPRPFVINFEFNLNQLSPKVDNFQSITFFNISTVELEFKNLNLSSKRYKINELKNQFQRLIKKETYWRQKEITLNKIR